MAVLSAAGLKEYVQSCTCFFTSFTKGNNFCDFLLGSLGLSDV